MAVDIDDIRIGDKIQVRGQFNTGPIVIGEVVGKEWDESRGCMLIDYEYNGEGFWAYIDQVIKIVN